MIIQNCEFANHSYVYIISSQGNSTNDNTLNSISEFGVGNDINILIEYSKFGVYTARSCCVAD